MVMWRLLDLGAERGDFVEALLKARVES